MPDVLNLSQIVEEEMILSKMRVKNQIGLPPTLNNAVNLRVSIREYIKLSNDRRFKLFYR